MVQNQNKKEFKNGFSLLEVIVSIGIIVTVITSVTGILVTTIRANSDNQDTLVAYGLAQEGLEGMRMIRDSNFLLGVGFNGVPENSQQKISVWGTAVFEGNAPKDLVLVKNLNLLPAIQCDAKNFQKECLPFYLEQAGVNNEIILKDDNGNYLQGSQAQGNLTQFSRVISIEPKEDSLGNIHELTVTSTVNWKDNNQMDRSLKLSSILTDWKFKQ